MPDFGQVYSTVHLNLNVNDCMRPRLYFLCSVLTQVSLLLKSEKSEVENTKEMKSRRD